MFLKVRALENYMDDLLTVIDTLESSRNELIKELEWVEDEVISISEKYVMLKEDYEDLKEIADNLYNIIDGQQREIDRLQAGLHENEKVKLRWSKK